MGVAKIFRSLILLAASVGVLHPISASAQSVDKMNSCNKLLKSCSEAPINFGQEGQAHCQISFYRCIGRPIPANIVNIYCTERIDTCLKYKYSE